MHTNHIDTTLGASKSISLADVAQNVELHQSEFAPELSYGFVRIDTPLSDATFSSSFEVGVEASRGRLIVAGLFQLERLPEMPTVLNASRAWVQDSQNEALRLQEISASHLREGHATYRRNALLCIRALALAIATESIDIGEANNAKASLDAFQSYYNAFRYTNDMLVGQRFVQHVVRVHVR